MNHTTPVQDQSVNTASSSASFDENTLRYFQVKRFAYPLTLGVFMPIIMTIGQGTFAMPNFLFQLVVYVVISLVLGAYLLPMEKISNGFVTLIHAQRPAWLRLIVSPIPGSLIFGAVMGFAAIVMNVFMVVGVIPGWFTFFLKGLPKGVLVATVLQIVLELVLEKIVRPRMTRNHE
ncbi:MAG: hypothetical protein SPI12_00975 [Actinomycetaceae bacterium]|nr:hypothetical protein [Actinomycetaceae bacterium]MDY6082421.1 hypothetical protein [Actinomycetaceae bacterium]